MDPNEIADEQIRAVLRDAKIEVATARFLVGIASTFSLIASLGMVGLFISFQESRRCGRRVLFCLHLSDAGASLAWLLTLWLPTETTRTGPLCRSQSYMLVFFTLSSYVWSACFAFHLYQILGRRSKFPELYEHRYHLIAWGFPATTVLQLSIQQMSGFALLGESGRPWCWFRSWNRFEWSDAGFHVQLLMFYVPVAIVLVHNLATYIALLYRMNDLLSTNMEGRIWRRMMVYTWVFFLSVVWGAFAFLYQEFSNKHEISRIMLYSMSFFTPLQGAMNVIAYGINSKLKSRLQAVIIRFNTG